MSDETNGSNGRLNRIEEDIAAIASNVRELTALSLRNEFNLAQYRQANEEWKQQMQAHVGHLTELVRIFGDKTFEFDEKVKRVKDAL